jgi:hypothetical protein
MTVWNKVKRVVMQYFNQANALTILVGTLLYAVIAWFLLYLAKETPLTDPVDFLYYF